MQERLDRWLIKSKTETHITRCSGGLNALIGRMCREKSGNSETQHRKKRVHVASLNEFFSVTLPKHKQSLKNLRQSKMIPKARILIRQSVHVITEQCG